MDISLKKGTHFQLIVVMDLDEWNVLSPFDGLTVNVSTGNNFFPLDILVDEETRTIVASSPTDDWVIGKYKCEIKIEKNGAYFFIPPKSFFTFEIHKSF